MHYAFALAALAATAYATDSPSEKEMATWGHAKVVNRCPYDVYLWSIDKELGCNPEDGKKLSKGQSYSERFRPGKNAGGISIKISKFNQCGGKDQTQLEYRIDPSEEYGGNYLDMSFVDCLGGNCPGWKDGFYMASGKTGAPNTIKAATVNNEHCPEFMVNNPIEAAKVSYVLPDDRQTKFCPKESNLDLYLCGSEKPGASDDSAPSAVPSSSTKAPAPSQAKPSTFSILPSKPVSSSQVAVPSLPANDDFKVNAAAVTDAPKAPAPGAPVAVTTVITYVTVDAPARKRHAHGRRHNRA
ncbi:unnamed protein product [Periconia digitata]|uniref:Uncharacterized protein n=1 Tax=Periconia digitata TaxID=1303443 RepID=A0A9W4XR22_9PLEO|nr:unnamed protein product [Periconia digitata]